MLSHINIASTGWMCLCKREWERQNVHCRYIGKYCLPRQDANERQCQLCCTGVGVCLYPQLYGDSVFFRPLVACKFMWAKQIGFCDRCYYFLASIWNAENRTQAGSLVTKWFVGCFRWRNPSWSRIPVGS